MSNLSTPPVTYDVADGVATVTLNRPDAMNSLTLSTKVALRDAMHAAAADSAVRCVVLTGTGRAFCVGQDLKEHVAELTGDSPSLGDTVMEHYNPTVTAIATMPKPVIAAVNGIAAGAGSSLAFAADFRILRRSAGFNLAFAGIALSCDTGASWTLPRLVGHGKATELLMQPRTIPADEAYALGLATTVVDDDAFEAEIATLARSLADGPTLALASIKRALAFSATHDLPSSLEHEAQKMALTGASADHLAAVQAFLAKEKPVFTGR
ncbi:enoyl-CoA hydratase [Aeromicrobium sp. A1-2]|uniref:enoyl-CoA hydratase-related protein n=1 Tax=Aeromicrobium sp. A1-2 TaxID=2107713 RepID=UPI000E5014C2|nr:enoyl-CoA hydratase-related protein [Aeromicrobium sp. A1-2]AXT84167.1 enoyl-CoA hydratase [Aeromicrobium sp. A1-2]